MAVREIRPGGSDDYDLPPVARKPAPARASEPVAPVEPRESAARKLWRAIVAVHVWLVQLLSHVPTAAENVVIGSVALGTFATSADNVLALGRLVHIHGWHSWVVAGTGEILASYSFLEFRRRQSWARVLPLVVFLVAAAFILLANLASAGVGRWAYDLLPWADIYRAWPAVVFLVLMLLVETKSAARKKRTAPTKTATPSPGAKSSPKPKPELPQGPHAVPDLPRDVPTPRKGEEREAAVTRWVKDGHRPVDIIAAGIKHYGKSEATIKRDLRNAKKAAS